jgi:hypothetical protein
MMAEMHRSDAVAVAELTDTVIAGIDVAGADVAKQARVALSRSRIFDLRRLNVEEDGDSIVLRGRVSSYYHKQLAQEVVRNATDGAEVINAIRVVYHADRYETERYDRAS